MFAYESLIVLWWPCLKSQSCHLIRSSFFCLVFFQFCGQTWERVYIWEFLKCAFTFDTVWLFWGDRLKFQGCHLIRSSFFCLPSPLSVLWTNLRKGLYTESFWNVFVYDSLTVLSWPCLKSQGCHLIWSSFFCTILSVLWTDLKKGLCIEVLKCVCLWQSLIVLKWPCAVDRTLKSNY